MASFRAHHEQSNYLSIIAHNPEQFNVFVLVEIDHCRICVLIIYNKKKYFVRVVRRPIFLIAEPYYIPEANAILFFCG